MWPCKKSFAIGIFCLFAAFLPGGCTTEKTTVPARSATEQLLLSTAADRALQATDFTIFAGRKVFLDAAYFDSYDAKYALGTVRDALNRAGALLEDNATNCDIIIEARSGALSVDSSDVLFGVPSLAAPIPLAGSLAIPELALYKSQKQRSFAKIALLAFARKSGAHVYSSGSLDGTAYDKRFRVLFVHWIRTDLPEKQQRQTRPEPPPGWFPQYDPMNLPATNAPATSRHSGGG